MHNSILFGPYNVVELTIGYVSLLQRCPYYRGVLIERYHTIEYKGTYCRVILYQVIVSIIEYYSYTVDVHM